MHNQDKIQRMVLLPPDLRQRLDEVMVLNGQKFSPLVCVLLEQYLSQFAVSEDDSDD